MGFPEFGKDLLIRLRLTLRAAVGCPSPFGRFQGMQILGNGALKARFTALASCEAKGDVLGVDIKSREE